MARRIVGIESKVLVEGEVSAEAKNRVGARSFGEGCVPVGSDDSDIAAPKEIASHPENREVGGGDEGIVLDAASLDVEGADTVGAGTAGQPTPDLNRVDAVVGETDAAAEEHDGSEIGDLHSRSGGTSAPQLLHAAELKNRLPLQEKVAFLGEEEAESRQVDLLVVLLDLREVGVVGEMGDESAGYGVFGVETDVSVRVVRKTWIGCLVRGAGGECVGVHLEVSR